MICGAEACKLGAMIHSAELRVHFLKSFQKRSTCENLSQKGLKIKKVGRRQLVKVRYLPIDKPWVNLSPIFHYAQGYI
jgi:hypothetical protein